MTVFKSFFDESAIYCVLVVLWMASGFRIKKTYINELRLLLKIRLHCSSCFLLLVLLIGERGSVYYRLMTRQPFHLDLRSLGNTNRKSYRASWLVPSPCGSNDRKCPKSCSVHVDFGTWYVATRLLSALGSCFCVCYYYGTWEFAMISNNNLMPQTNIFCVTDGRGLANEHITSLLFLSVLTLWKKHNKWNNNVMAYRRWGTD